MLPRDGAEYTTVVMAKSLQDADSERSARPVAVITGASAGIGRALALEFAAHGYDLLLIARQSEGLQKVGAEIEAEYDIRVFAAALDVTDPDTPAQVVAFLEENRLSVDVLVNNAASWLVGPMGASDTDEAIQLMVANMAAPYALTRALLPGMISRGGGAILNVGSLAGELPSPGVAIYSASKSFLRSMTLALRHEVRGDNITVSLLVPGLVETGFTQAGQTAAQSGLRGIFASSPADIAAMAYRGLIAGKAIIIPGLVSRALYLGLRLIPERLAVRLRAMRGFGSDAGGDAQIAEPATFIVSAGILTRLRRALDHHRIVALVLLFCLMAAFSGFATYKKASRSEPSVDRASAVLAVDMLAAYRHTDATTAGRPPPGRSGEMAVAPGYALILFGMALVDRHVEAGLACMVSRQRCDAQASFSSIAMLQLVCALAGLALLFGAAFRLSGSWEIAVLTLIVAYIGSRVGDFAGLIRPLLWPPLLTYASLYLLCEAFARQNVVFALGAGIAIGFGGLISPFMLVLAPVAAVLLALLPQHNPSWQAGVASALALIVGAATALVLLAFAHAHSYDVAAFVRLMTSFLSERVAYQEMGLTAWFASLLLPLPLVGGLMEIPFSDETVRLFVGLHGPGSYPLLGLTEIYPKTLAHAASPFGQYAWLINTYIAPNIAAYLLVTPSLFMRGVLAGSDLIGLLGLFHLRTLFTYSRIDNRLAMLVLISLPIAVLFILNLFLSANHFFQNPGLIFLYSYAIAYVAGRF